MRMRNFLAFIASVGVQIQLNHGGKLITTFIREFFKDNNMGLLKIHNGVNYAHYFFYFLFVFTETWSELVFIFNLYTYCNQL